MWTTTIYADLLIACEGFYDVMKCWHYAMMPQAVPKSRTDPYVRTSICMTEFLKY
jgi:hypothetical protein